MPNTQEKNKENISVELPKGKYFGAVGRRKRAIARVRIYPGKGKFYYNNKITDAPNKTWLEPLNNLSLLGKFDFSITTKGGGIKSQAEAVRLGISRALLKYDEKLKSSLRLAGFLTRDPREKERKKPGLKRARRAPQWAKR